MSETATSSGSATGNSASGRELLPQPHGGRIAPPWKKGQRGNPSGKSGAYLECQRICREASPRAAARLVELMEDSDTRVGLMAAQAVMDRGVGKPDVIHEEPRTLNADNLTDDQQRALLILLKKAMGM
jgi:hypothetical protein